MDFLGGLIGAGAKIFEGFMNRDSAKDAQQRAIDDANYRAQTQLTFRAQDATNAEAATGINRLALLGISPGSGPSFSAGDTGMGSAVGEAGQNIGRAVASLADKKTRADELNEQLLEAKIANVNADTVRMTAIASKLATNLGQPGTGPGVPLPQEDPRGPVINMMQRARMPNGEIVEIFSEKAASPMQTMGMTPLNAAIAARSLGGGVGTATKEYYDMLSGGVVPQGGVDRSSQFLGVP